ncbi:hypothetical protein ACPCHQ_11875 [Ralstonia thomasii]|jgi:hypothetical protein|uniref:Uncharacterized protein n=2 Tax=Ralstonia TaxID=48736 RepID=A0ABN9IWZ2_9RALS|nr:MULTISPECIES: hypothetical protein [Ralstonia]MBT2177735.1 hypothetical protein [Ralstonia pickettii]CAJ0710582.1 hypothetical protein LMG7143_01632 [Ralstonia sp. LMG 18095]CAJ0792259.1 hypothetical protein LMG18095_02290 [Ralstonia sp. LMG 18095]CAJ0900477.1 hypothetical protein R6138_04461 [Ralstonia sp. LMG 18095]
MLSDDQIQAVWEGLQWKDLDPLHPDFNKRLNLRFGHAVEDAALRAQADAGPVGDESQMPRVHGVSRIADNPCSVLVMLMAEPSDDALREIHDRLRAQSGQRAGVAEGWRLYSADFSMNARNPANWGTVMLTRDDSGSKWWHALSDEKREKIDLFVSGRGTTFDAALQAANEKAAIAAPTQQQERSE